METTIIRSKRKTLSMELKDGAVIVRAPNWVSRKEIDEFIDSHQEWLRKAIAREEQRRAELEQMDKLTASEWEALFDAAKIYIPLRVEHFAPLVGVDYGKITIRRQHTRWGSCSAKGNLSFNGLLMLAPPSVLDSVVVHELCHRKEMNHSPRFYAHLLRVMPDYQLQHKWLQKNSQALFSMMPE